MAIRLSLGLTKKLGLPTYTSVGASCHLECEIDASALHADARQFHVEAQRLFKLCRPAVHEQLGREIPASHERHVPMNGRALSACPGRSESNGARDDLAESFKTEPEEVGISERQLAFIQDLAAQIQGLGIRRLPVLVALQYDKNLIQLCCQEASRLITLLNQLRSGKIALHGLFAEDTTER